MGRQKRSSQSVTIKDIARLAGVSVSTVSRVLNHLDRVSDETRTRVNDAVEKLGYTQNALATSLVTGQTRIVMIVVPDFILDFNNVALQFAEDTFRRHGYQSMIFFSGEDPEADPLSYLNRYIHLIDGALVVPTRNRIFDLQRFRKPIVLINRTMAGCELNSVTIDNFRGCYTLTQLLLEKNHKKIAILPIDTDMNIGTDCLQGFCQAMLDAGLRPEDRYIRRCQINQVGILNQYWSNGARNLLFRQSSYLNTLDLLAMEDPPTAIVACNENICAGCLQALQENHLVPGKDISLVSFDDLSTPLVTPGITSAFTPRDLIGRYGAERLLEMIANPDDHRIIHRELDSCLMLRESIVQL